MSKFLTDAEMAALESKAPPKAAKKVLSDAEMTAIEASESQKPAKPLKESLVEGVQDAATSFDPAFGFRDELWGVLGAALDPSDVKGDFKTRYTVYRDADRKAKADAEIRSPVASTVGKFAGEVTSTALPLGKVAQGAGLAGMAVVNAAQAGMQAAGDAKDDTFGDAIKGAAIGGAMVGVPAVALGAGAKAATKVANSKLVGKAVDVVDNFGKDVLNLGISLKTNPTGVVKALSEIGQTAKLNSGVKSALEATTGKSLSGATDREMRELMYKELSKEGDSTFKKFIAEEVGKRTGKNSEQFHEVIKLGSPRRNEVRAWDNAAQLAEGEQVAKKIGAMTDEVEVGRSLKRDGLEAQAAREFAAVDSSAATDDVFAFIDELLPTDAGQLSLIPSKNQAELRKARALLEDGAGVRGASRLGLSEGKWADSLPAERYARLQQARELVDEQRVFFGAQGQGKSERMMLELRGKIDDALKLSSAKQKSDSLWSESQKALDNLQGPMSYRSPSGETSLDAAKVKNSFRQTDGGARAEDYVEMAKQKFNELELGDPRTRDEAFGAWEAGKKKADHRALVDRFEHDGAPSGLPIERLQTANTKNAIQELLASPANVLRKLDEVVKANGRSWSKEELDEVVKWKAVFNQLAKASPAQPIKEGSGITKLVGGMALTKVGSELVKKLTED